MSIINCDVSRVREAGLWPTSIGNISFKRVLRSMVVIMSYLGLGEAEIILSIMILVWLRSVLMKRSFENWGT
jgi:hypothetical protein